MSSLPRPDPSEYVDYYGLYVGLVPDGDIVRTLREQLGETGALLDGLTPEQETFRDAPGKCSLRVLVGHLIDTERMFAFRALAMARADSVLPGMDQDEWMQGSNAGDRDMADLLKEWISVRRSNVHMFATLPEGAGARVGQASGYDFTVQSLPWIIAGHELWHRAGLKRDYLAESE